jgi:hypothetical protein
MPDAIARAALALSLALLLGFALGRSSHIPRDLALGQFADATAVLGIFAVFGPLAALFGAFAIVGAFVIGAAVYGAIALAARLAR